MGVACDNGLHVNGPSSCGWTLAGSAIQLRTLVSFGRCGVGALSRDVTPATHRKGCGPAPEEEVVNQQSPQKKPKGDVFRVTLFVATIWLILSGPAYGLRGALGLEGLTYAALLCWIPGVALFALVLKKSDSPVDGRQALQVLAAMTGRMLFVLIGVLALQEFRPELRMWEFLAWLIIYYFATLAFETYVFAKRQQSTGSVTQSSGVGE